MLEKCYEKERDTNIKYVGYALMEINGNIVTNFMKEAIRIEDAKASFKKYVEEKFKHYYQFIDLDARNGFRNK